MAIEMGPEMALLKALVIDSWKKSSLMKNAFGPVPFGSSSPKSYAKLKTMVTDILEDQQQEALTSQLGKGRIKDTALPHVLSKQCCGTNGDCKRLTSRGSCSGGATRATKLDDQTRGKGKGNKPPRTPSPPNRRPPSSHPEVSNRTGTNSQDETFDLLFLFQERNMLERKIAICVTLRSSCLPKESRRGMDHRPCPQT